MEDSIMEKIPYHETIVVIAQKVIDELVQAKSLSNDQLIFTRGALMVVREMLEKTTIPEKHVPSVVSAFRELQQKASSVVTEELLPTGLIDSLSLPSKNNADSNQSMEG